MAYSDLQSRAFTQIAYMNLDEKFVDYCKTNGTDSAPLSKILSEGQLSELKSLGLTEGEINSWSISGVHNTNSDNGFYACIIETGPGEAAVGFRGSESMGSLDNVINDWVKADIGLVNSTCTNQHAEVERFLEKYKDQLNKYDSLAMTGHSLGGNLAEYATIVSGNYGLDDNIDQCVSMDGPGFSQEFIFKYRDEIEKMSGVMYHPRWSFVGTMLNDLPGVQYKYVKVSNDANKLDGEAYNSFTRHSTKYLVFDENGNLAQGKQDTLSVITSTLSEGVDHMPQPIGDILITIVGSVWIGAQWASETLFEDGHPTPTGWAVISGAIVAASMIGISTIIASLLYTVVAIVAVLVVAFVAELIFDFVVTVVDAICDAAIAAYNWLKERAQEFIDGVKACIERIAKFLKETFDNGYKYATNNPEVKLNTTTLEWYAGRLRTVNNKLKDIDEDFDRLYKKVGWRDLKTLWDLMKADIATGESWRLKKCINYLNNTASRYESTEEELTLN